MSARVARTVAERARKVRFLLLDVDGVLTDGRIIHSSDGVETLAFDVKDGHGLARLRRAGIELGLLSGRDSPAVPPRADELGIAVRLMGIDDKLAAYEELRDARGMADEEFAYVGDDLTDLEVLRTVGLSAAPADAMEAAREAALVVTERAGGRGAVREVCDLLLAARGNE